MPGVEHVRQVNFLARHCEAETALGSAGRPYRGGSSAYDLIEQIDAGALDRLALGIEHATADLKRAVSQSLCRFQLGPWSGLIRFCRGRVLRGGRRPAEHPQA